MPEPAILIWLRRKIQAGQAPPPARALDHVGAQVATISRAAMVMMLPSAAPGDAHHGSIDNH